MKIPALVVSDRTSAAEGVSNKKVFTPGKLGPLALRNRVIKAATFEGMCPNGTPSDALIEFHRRVAAGGAGMTTVAYCSVSSDGRTYAIQMHMREEIVPALRRLTDAVHREGAAACLQLGHSGYFADGGVIGKRPIAPSVLFNTYGLNFSRAMRDDDIRRVTIDFGRAAALAVESGFDAIEIQLGHGYLLSQFLSPYTNRRRDHYGGSLENRLRFPIAVIQRVRDAVGPGVAVVAKMNLTDGFRGGLGLDEAVLVAAALEAAGVDGLVLSGGFVSKTSLFMMRGEVPLQEMIDVQTSVVRKAGLFLFGKIFVKAYPFEEMFFLSDARQVRARVKVPLVLLGGIRSLSNMQAAMAGGFDFVAMARALIREPDLVRRIQQGLAQDGACIPCNRCIAEMDRGGVRCVFVPEGALAGGGR